MLEIIKLKSGDQRLGINQIGAGITEYYLDEPDGRRDIIYGYSKSENKVGSMGEVLFPFPGRVENSKYQFNGHEYNLSDVKIKDGHAIHGFVKGVDWQIEKKSESKVSLSFRLKKEEYANKGYPFSMKITIDYSLSTNGLTCQTRVENVGQESAPFGLGFHPYFTVGTNNIDDIILKIRAKKLVEFDSGLKPTGELINLSGSDLDFNQPKKISIRIIDNCYADLIFDFRLEGVETHLQGVGTAKTVLSDGKDCKIIIWQDENFPYLQIYSADTIGEQHRRKGFAVEPQTCSGFAFNVPEMGLKVLQPGETFQGSWGVSNKISNS